MDKLLTSKQVAEILGMHINTVWKYINTGKLSAVKICNRWRVKESDLSLFINGNR